MRAGRTSFGKWIQLVVSLFALAHRCPAQQQDLSELSIQDLMQVKVTSVAKREERLEDSPAAIYVITQDDIRRSGMTSVPELLRMVPGLDVAQIDGNLWAISARGFNSEFANNLLVLIDGRTVYDPTFGGVYWDVQDQMLEDIERIEVIRGPGAAIWGANAVNGVINIITKRARDTQGGLITTDASTAEQRGAGMRYGGTLGPDRYFRAYGKFFKRDGFAYPDGDRSPDGWDMVRGGFRSDLQISAPDSLTVQGDLYHGNEGQNVTFYAADPLFYSANDSIGVEGGNLLSRWRHSASPRSDFSLQAYFDETQREEYLIGKRVTTFDLEFQNHQVLGQRQELTWGLNYRRVQDALHDSPTASLTRDQEGTNLFGSFLQDEIAMFHRRLHFVLGSKFEHNDYTGFNVQPTARILAELTSKQRFWVAVSRAISPPSQSEREFQVAVQAFPTAAGPPTVVSFVGNPDLQNEQLLAYEAGYRWEIGDRLSLDLASFYDFYHGIDALVPSLPSLVLNPVPHVLLPLEATNEGHAHTYGGEAALNLDVTHFWRLSVSNSQFQLSQYVPFQVAATLSPESPGEQFGLRSGFRLPRRVEADMATYYVSRLPQQQVPSYTRLDARLGWHVGEQWELSVGGQNLLQAQHSEFRSLLGITPTKVRRNVFLKATWRF
jgi:iron complex outermembrane recepter protein